MGRLEDTSILKRIHASNGSTKRGVASQAGWMTLSFLGRRMIPMMLALYDVHNEQRYWSTIKSA